MNAELRCPLCKQPLTQDQYDKVLNIWGERKKALANLKEELARQRAGLAQEKARLAGERRGLRKRLSEALAKARAKAKAKLEMREAQMRTRIERKYLAAARIQERRAARSAAALAALKSGVTARISAAVASESRKMRTGFKRELRTLKAEVARQVRQAERVRVQRLTQSLDTRGLKIKELSMQLKELKRQLNAGTTPQVEGFLFEDNLVAELKKVFATDKFTHTGKGGDILHEVWWAEKCVGLIVYECKRVDKFKVEHIGQARTAKQQRSADYAVLVTNARKKGQSGFFVEADVLVVHPAGVVSLAGLLRESLLSIARANIRQEQREEMLRKTLVFLESADYQNHMRDTIQRTKDLYAGLTAEVQDHVKLWRKRYDHYRAIHGNVTAVGARVNSLLAGSKEGDQEVKALPAPYPPEPEILRPASKDSR